MDRIHASEGKGWNQGEVQEQFFKSSKLILGRYYVLAMTTPELFEDADANVPGDKFAGIQQFLDPNDEEAKLAFRVNQIIFWKYDSTFMNLFWSDDNIKDINDKIADNM